MCCINFDNMPSKYWDDHVKISYLQRRIIIYSIMYYELNESCVSDKLYDSISQQLVNMQQSVDKEEFKKSKYYYAMHDYNGSTGFYISSRLSKDDYEYLTKIAQIVLKIGGQQS